MKRTPLKRKKLLKADPETIDEWRRRSRKAAILRRREQGSKGVPSRRHPIAKRGKKWKEKRERDFGAKGRAVVKMACAACGRRPSECHHEPPLSRGGNSDGIVPLCADCHRLAPDSRHRLGSVERFRQVRGIDLRLEAQRIDTWWRSIQG